MELAVNNRSGLTWKNPILFNVEGVKAPAMHDWNRTSCGLEGNLEGSVMVHVWREGGVEGGTKSLACIR